MRDSFALKPFLLRFAEQRQDEPSIDGRYCDARQVWIVEIDGVETPIVETRAVNAELQTKTRVNAEDDDEASNPYLELVTKTKVQVEEDDDDVQSIVALIEDCAEPSAICGANSVARERHTRVTDSAT